VAEICRRLDGIPLAIELAAARAGVISPEEILSRLEDRFRFLTSAPRTAAARHQTLRAALDWSYELLEADEGLLFRRLSVFAGGFSLETAEAVCAFDGLDAVRVLDLLGHLVDQSLVFVLDLGGGRTRYGLLETVRAYGREKLDQAGETAAVRHRHAEYFLELVETAEPLLGSQGGQGWLERLVLDHDNLRSALDNSEPAIGLRLVGAMSGFWDLRGQYTEGRTRLTAALARGSEPTAARARALRSAGFMAWTQGDHDAATTWCQESLAMYRRLGMQAEAGMCLQQLGQTAFQQEDFAGAREFLREALEIASAVGDERLAELCRFRMGAIALFEEDHAEARRLLDACLQSSRRDGHEEMVVMTLLVLGHLELREGRLDKARTHLTESLAAWQARGGPRQIASLLDGFASLAAAEGHAEPALRLAAAAENLREEVAVAPGSALQRDLIERLRPARASLGGLGTAAGLGPPMSRAEAIAYALEQAG
jgi:tetratricopeptide (TPR) repeat protein